MIVDQARNVAVWFGERWSYRIEISVLRFKQVLDLEEKLFKEKRAESVKSTENIQTKREPHGWLICESKSHAIPLYAGINLIEGIELRLTGSALLFKNRTIGSNDQIQLGEQNFFVKLLPPHYRSEGSGL